MQADTSLHPEVLSLVAYKPRMANKIKTILIIKYDDQDQNNINNRLLCDRIYRWILRIQSEIFSKSQSLLEGSKALGHNAYSTFSKTCLEFLRVNGAYEVPINSHI